MCQSIELLGVKHPKISDYMESPVKFFACQLSSAVNSLLQLIAIDEIENQPRQLKFGTFINFSMDMKIQSTFLYQVSSAGIS